MNFPNLQSINPKRNLLVPLSGKEKEEYGMRLAGLERERTIIEDERKASVDGYKKRLSDVIASISRIAAAMNDGFEHRDIDCQWVYYWNTLTKQLIRKDTGKVIETQIIEEHERQKLLNLKTPPRGDAPEEPDEGKAGGEGPGE